MYDNEYNSLIASTKVKSHPIFLERMKEEYFLVILCISLWIRSRATYGTLLAVK
jgi:hypothetical protein